MIRIIRTVTDTDIKFEEPAKLKLFKYLWAKGVRDLNADTDNTKGIKLLELSFSHPSIVE